jgi:hypothetical protein
MSAVHIYVVCGGGINTAMRAEKCAEDLKKTPEHKNIIVVCCGKPLVPKTSITEAQEAAGIIKASGWEGRVLIEEESTDAWSNFHYAAKQVGANGVLSINFYTAQWACTRFWILAKKQWSWVACVSARSTGEPKPAKYVVLEPVLTVLSRLGIGKYIHRLTNLTRR